MGDEKVTSLFDSLTERMWLPFETGNYAYVCARVKAKKSLLLPKETYVKFLKMSTPEISRYLGEGTYKNEMLELGARYSGVDLIEMATRNNLSRVFTQILEFSEGDLKKMVSRFLDRWDVWNIKTIIRGEIYGATPDEISENLIPAGGLREAFLLKVSREETIEEAVEKFQKTVYYDILKDFLDRRPEMSTGDLEDALTHRYYSTLLEAVPPRTLPTQLFRMFIRKEIDIFNIKTLFRMSREEKKVERDVFLPGGLKIPIADIEELMTLAPEELHSRLKKYSFYEEISPFLKDIETMGLTPIERALEKHLLREASRYSHVHPLSVLPVLDYLTAKQIEVENIRIIARGKKTGLSEERMKELLVI